jgi:hypothetical protein
VLAVCPEGYYGDHCMMPCECPNENFLCHAKDGCVCRQGYTGTCDVTLVWFQICHFSFLTYLLFVLLCGPLTSTGFTLNYHCVGLECLNPPQYDTLSLHFNLLQTSWHTRTHVGHLWILLQTCVGAYAHMHICNRICLCCIPLLETSLLMAMLRPKHVGGTL